jgi:hypothetical protein
MPTVSTPHALLLVPRDITRFLGACYAYTVSIQGKQYANYPVCLKESIEHAERRRQDGASKSQETELRRQKRNTFLFWCMRPALVCCGRHWPAADALERAESGEGLLQSAQQNKRTERDSKV